MGFCMIVAIAAPASVRVLFNGEQDKELGTYLRLAAGYDEAAMTFYYFFGVAN